MDCYRHIFVLVYNLLNYQQKLTKAKLTYIFVNAFFRSLLVVEWRHNRRDKKYELNNAIFYIFPCTFFLLSTTNQ